MALQRNLILTSVALLLLLGGCGGNKMYVSPEGDDTARVVLVNDIFRSGFYVEVDEKDAGYMHDTITITLAPGDHEIKVYNSETAVEEEAKTTKHTFKFEVELNKGETQTINLAWDDPNYAKDVRNVSKSIRPDDEEKKKKNERPTFPGM